MQDVLSTYRDDVADQTSAYLGRIVFVTVSDSSVHHTTLAAQLKATGLERFTPRPPCDADVFRRVFQNGQRRQHDTDDPNVTIKLLVRPVQTGGGKVYKQIVVEQVDAEGHHLGYTPAVEVAFDPEHPGNLVVSLLDMDADSRAMRLASELSAQYREEVGSVNGQAVRDVIKRSLESALAISIKGGVHFVMEANADLVDAVERFASHLPGCDVHSLPLIDTGKQRDMVKRAYEDETVGELDRLTAELRELAGKDTAPSARVVATLTARRVRLVEKLGGYSDLLEENLSLTEHKLKILEARMGQLVSKGMAMREAPAA